MTLPYLLESTTTLPIILVGPATVYASNIPIPGIDFIGEIPPEVQKTVLFSAGITSNVVNINASRDLIAFLASPKAAPTIQKAGLKPVLPALPW